MTVRTFGMLIITAFLTGCGEGGTMPKGGSPTGGSATTASTTPSSTTSSSVKATLDAQGATFVEPIMKVWTNEFAEKTEGRIRVNYQGTGSGAGIAQMIAGKAAYGCSDAPMNKKQLDEAMSKGGAVVHVPLVIGAVVPMYNLEVAEPLVFTGPVLADIFTGKITKWDDPKLVELNKTAKLPDLAIQPVYRADPSGTSFIFSDYLAKVSEEFKKTVGASTTPNWPEKIGIKHNKTDGVAGHISRTVGAIGYVELTFALDTKSKYGKVRNKAGKDILANLDSITAAAAASLGQKQTAEPYSLHEFTYNLTNADGDASYPIAGMSFAVIFNKLSGTNGKATIEFLKWATSAEAQGYAKKRNYAALPDALQQQIAEKLGKVEVP
jgi:phosphate transport system substrate-binding protein